MGDTLGRSVSEDVRAKFASFEKIDAHLHFNAKNLDILALSEEYRFNLISVNVEFPEFGPIADQRNVVLELIAKETQRIHYVTSFSMENWERSGWLDSIMAQIDADMQQGALGVKIWKNIGMEVRDKTGSMVLIDDARLDGLFDFLEERGYPVVMHQAEPKNCWLPLNEMTMKYDREYFKMHPEYHFYLHGELPTYEQLLAARDRRLQKNPFLPTIQAHLGSMEWSVEHIAAFLDRFPNAVVDTAARMNHLMLQAQKDLQQVRDFFVRYQDRILYGTDFFITHAHEPNEMKALENIWLRDWTFLSTGYSMDTDEFEGPFQGLELPFSVLQKVYYRNAQRVFGLSVARNLEFIYV